MTREKPRILLSFDTEEFDLPGEYGEMPPLDVQLEVGARGLEAVLDLLDRLGPEARATFFTTAVFAQNRPALIARLLERHELASHGWSHTTFERGDAARSKEELERLSGRPVLGFRRARFGPFDRAELREAGYRYDSSLNPIWLPGRYNNLGKPRTVHRLPEGPVEIPVSASPCLRFPLFWLAFKHAPLPLFRAATRSALAADGHVNLFFHPWEFTSLEGFRLPGIVTRRAGEGMGDRLEAYLRWLRQQGDAAFETLGEFSARWDAAHPPAPR